VNLRLDRGPIGPFHVDPSALAAYGGEMMRMENHGPSIDVPKGTTWMCFPRTGDKGDLLRRLGKSRAGRMLDGRLHEEWPA
jgi:hypothetical protein